MCLSSGQWGEFQYPNLHPFPGAEFCRHNAQMRSWREVEGEEALIIGGYESGIDAAINLCKLGVRVLNGQPIWNNISSDPSGLSVPLHPLPAEYDPQNRVAGTDWQCLNLSG